MTTATKRKRKPRPRCVGCDNAVKLDRDVCDDCYEYYEWCDVCRSSQSRTDECRHLVWTEWGYTGSGAYEGDWSDARGDFFAILDVLVNAKIECLDEDCPDLISAIETEIARDRFHTWLAGPMLGCPTVYFKRLRPDLPQRNEDGSPYSLGFAQIYGAELDDSDGESEDETEETNGDPGIGFGWLQSLFCEDTKEANAVTVSWIQLWRACRRLAVLNGPQVLKPEWIDYVRANPDKYR